MHKDVNTMLLEQVKKQLIDLNNYESMGKQHRKIYGSNITELHLIYLMVYGHRVSKPEDLYTMEAVAEQLRIRDHYRQDSKPGTLSSSTFFPEEKNVEIQQLLRYVDITPHQHEFIECAYVVTGKCLHRINEREYLQEAGSFVTIPQGYTHSLYPEEDCLCLTMKVRPETFQDLNLPGWSSYAFPLAFSCGADPFIRNTIAALWTQQEENLPYCDQIMEQLFKTLMLYLEQHFRDDLLYLITRPDQSSKIMRILSFMADNYQTITLQSVAEHFHYSPAYLSRLIRQRTGRTFSDVLKEYKLRRAAMLLKKGPGKLNDICETVGYKDVAQFIHSFKEQYGVTPAQYRKQHSIHKNDP